MCKVYNRLEASFLYIAALHAKFALKPALLPTLTFHQL